MGTIGSRGIESRIVNATGAAVVLSALLLIAPVKASAFQILASLCANPPASGADVTVGPGGVLYGSLAGFCNGVSEASSIFSLTPDPVTHKYAFVDLHDFPNNPMGDAAPLPNSVTVDGQGDIFGTTFGSGANFAGAVYKLASDGSFTTLHSFTHSDPYPIGRLVLDSKHGHLFGVTNGANYLNPNLNGTIFEIGVSGSAYRRLYGFTGGADGASPDAGLTMDQNGTLYGTTFLGGNSGNGTLFQITPGGSLITLYRFSGGDGVAPASQLALDANGNLFGTTYRGGTCSDGTIFKFALTTGTLTSLYSFGASSGCSSNPPDGTSPAGDMALDAQGNLYGTTSSLSGVIFQFTAGGTFNVLHSFTNSAASDGVILNPAGGVLFGADTDGEVFGLVP